MMEKNQIVIIKVISPMFSYGNGRLEPRPTELKGLLRNTYRISNPELDALTLYQQEVKLFGGQLKENGEGTMKASPLRLQIIYQESGDKDYSECLLLHKNIPKIKCYPYGTNFRVTFATVDSTLEQRYTDLLQLSLLIGGIGKRSRRGRGCMTMKELQNISKNDLPNKVVDLLNNVCEKEIYTVYAKGVTLKSSATRADNRPYIKEIRFGNTLARATRQDVNEYLKKVDQASHEIKAKYGNYKATGFANGRDRFASSVIVSLAEIKEGITPVYTLLYAVRKNPDGRYIELWNAAEEQYAFIDKIEGGGEK